MFEQNSEVYILHGSVVIGRAKLQPPLNTENNNYRRSSHNKDLTQFDKDGCYYVSIFNILIDDVCKNEKYNYPYYGNDDEPLLLNELYF